MHKYAPYIYIFVYFLNTTEDNAYLFCTETSHIFFICCCPREGNNDKLHVINSAVTAVTLPKAISISHIGTAAKKKPQFIKSSIYLKKRLLDHTCQSFISKLVASICQSLDIGFTHMENSSISSCTSRMVQFSVC